MKELLVGSALLGAALWSGRRAANFNGAKHPKSARYSFMWWKDGVNYGGGYSVTSKKEAVRLAKKSTPYEGSWVVLDQYGNTVAQKPKTTTP